MKKEFPSLLIIGNARHGVIVYINSVYLFIKGLWKQQIFMC